MIHLTPFCDSRFNISDGVTHEQLILEQGSNDEVELAGLDTNRMEAGKD